MSKPKISVEVTQEQYDVLSEEAKTAGKTLSALVRDRLFPEGGTALPEMMVVSVHVPAQSPVPAPTPPTPTPAPASSYHPCRHLLPVYPLNYGPSQCQGSCNHESQRGRPCFWMSNTAPHCNLFTQRSAMRR